MTANINTQKNIKLIHAAYVVGIILVIAGSLGHFFEIPFFKYIFGAGSVMVIISQMINAYKDKDSDFRKRRLVRMNLMLSLMLALATYSMFDGTTLWIAVVLIYALVTLVMSFRI
ncbi:MAG: hypothetical protein VB102_11185 [Paludibacter sp.]|nr:hypothetical protein [Paludibacter sp.]